LKNKQTAQGGGRYALILMSSGVKELMMLQRLYHTFEHAVRHPGRTRPAQHLLHVDIFAAFEV